MELFIKYPHEVQQELLHQLLNKAAQTEMGNRYGFESIRNYEDYKNRVPLVDYEDIEEQIERCRLGAQNIFGPPLFVGLPSRVAPPMPKVNLSP